MSDWCYNELYNGKRAFAHGLRRTIISSIAQNSVFLGNRKYTNEKHVRDSDESDLAHLDFLLGVVVGNETTVSVDFASLAWVHAAVVGGLGDVNRRTIWLPPTFNRPSTEARDVELSGARYPPNGAGVADKNLIFVNLQDEFDD